ncbi:MAG: tetratricopeptide repeat protein [Bacteroidota bacterium]
MAIDRLEQLLLFLKKDPNDAFTLYSIAYEFSSRKDHEKAIHYFTLLMDRHPDYVGLYYHLGKTYEETSQPELAEKTYRDGLDMATRERDRHAFAELQSALNKLLGLDYEDEV